MDDILETKQNKTTAEKTRETANQSTVLRHWQGQQIIIKVCLSLINK